MDREEYAASLFDRQSDLQSRISKLEDEIATLGRSISKDVVVKANTTVPAEQATPEETAVPQIPGDETLVEDETVDYQQFEAPEWCIPIKANVMTFEWDKLAQQAQFDCILMDPPWQLASAVPTRGVAIAYAQLPDVCIEELPIQKLQTNGFIFIWVINNKYTKAFDLMKRWGYEYVDRFI
ncbi:MAG: hypothetical protein SGCHY_000216 [Lobulomycetales sp.]